MAAALIIEQDSGTYSARRHHPHNGYYAGDFSDVPFRALESSDIPMVEPAGSPS